MAETEVREIIKTIIGKLETEYDCCHERTHLKSGRLMANAPTTRQKCSPKVLIIALLQRSSTLA